MDLFQALQELPFSALILRVHPLPTREEPATTDSDTGSGELQNGTTPQSDTTSEYGVLDSKYTGELTEQNMSLQCNTVFVSGGGSITIAAVAGVLVGLIILLPVIIIMVLMIR